MERFATKIVVFFLTIPLTILIARSLQPAGMGVWALVMLIPQMLFMFSELGVVSANTFRTGTAPEDLPKLASNSLYLGLIIGSGFSAIFVGVYLLGLFSAVFSGIEPLLVYLALLIVPFQLVGEYLSGILLGLKNFRTLNLVHVITNAAVLAAVFFLLVTSRVAVLPLVLIYVMVNVASAFAYLRAVRKQTTFARTIDLEALKSSLGFGKHIYASNLLWFFSRRLGYFFVGLALPRESLGHFVIAVGLAELGWFISNSIAGVLFAEVASGSPERKLEIASLTSRHSVILLTAEGILLALLAPVLIATLYGEAFLPSVSPLLIMIPGVIAYGIASPANSFLLGKGRVHYISAISVAEVTTNLLLILLLLPPYGLAGVAAAVSLTYMLGGIGRLLAFRAVSRLSWSSLLKPRLEDLTFYPRFAKTLLSNMVNRLRERRR